MLLDDQDRARWDQDLIATALGRLDASPSGWVMGPYRAQAEIARAHIVAATPDQTDWPRILRIYRALAEADDSPVIALNAAVALAMVEGPARGLAAVDEIGAAGELDDYALYHSSRADLLRRCGRTDDAAVAYRRALALVGTSPERRFLERRLAEVTRLT